MENFFKGMRCLLGNSLGEVGFTFRTVSAPRGVLIKPVGTGLVAC